MPVAVVFAFATADGLVPVVGAAPFDVLARQLPRLCVLHLNGDGDRGVRFFPFLGPVDGQRDFLRLPELLDPAQLAALHQQGPVRVLVDGILRPGELHWRILHGTTLEPLVTTTVPFDPRRPLDVLPRLEFELQSQLGWLGRPRPTPTLAGAALGWFLVLKDQLLRAEANLAASGDPLRPLRACLELAAAEASVQQVALDFATLWQRQHSADKALPVALRPLLAAPTMAVEAAERLAALLAACGDADGSATALARAAAQAPERTELVERATAALFRCERFAEAAAVVGRARELGCASPEALAQFAAVADRIGDRALRRQLTQELASLPAPSLPVARLLVSYLIEDGDPATARRIGEQALAADARQPLLQFDLARACLLLGDDGAARAALEAALQLGLPPGLAPQARRFLRLCGVPGLWRGALEVEDACAAGDLRAAARGLRLLLRRLGHQAELWFLAGVVRHRSGDEAGALRALRRALECDAGHAEAHNRLGVLLLGAGDVESGYRHLARAHELAPQEPSALLHLAQACALRGEGERAQEHLGAAERCGAAPQLLAAVRDQVRQLLQAG